MTPRIRPLPREQRGAATAELLDRLRELDGRELNIFTTLAHHPRLLKRWAAFGGTLLLRGELPRRDCELLILRTAWRCDAHYEWAQHVVMGRSAGLTDSQISTLRDEDPDVNDADLVLVEAADQLHASARIDDATWTKLAATYTVEQLIEICMVVGQYHLGAFVLNSLGVELEDED